MRKGTDTNRWAVTWEFFSRSSCAMFSVSTLTAALEVLYAALPLHNQESNHQSLDAFIAQDHTHGGLVIPCFEPVLITTLAFS